MANYQNPYGMGPAARRYGYGLDSLSAIEDTAVDPVITTGGPLPPEVLYTMQTGGNQPPAVETVMSTGGNLPPLSEPVMTTGGNLPPMSTGLPPLLWNTPGKPAPTMSTGLPPQSVQGTGGNLPPSVLTNLSLPAINGQNYVATLAPGQGGGQQFSPQQVVQAAAAAILGSDSPYIQRARTRGLEQAANRRLLNSSIAAGAAEGAAIDSAMPLIQNVMDVVNRREQQAFQGQQAALDRTQAVNNALLASELTQRQTAYDYNFRNQLQSNQTLQQDWLNDRNFSRDFNATLSMMPITNAFDLSRMIQQYALEEPEVYTPQVISGMTNFFQQNMLSMLQQYFPSLYGTSNGGTP